MKDILLHTVKLLLLAVPFVLLVGIFYVSPQKVDFSDLKAETESAMDLTEMQQADAQILRRLYGRNGGEGAGGILRTAQDNK